MIHICVLGSSYMWSPTLVKDLMATFSEPLEIRFIDIDAKAADFCRQWAEAASQCFGRSDRFLATTDRREALKGADAVLITLSTGGLAAMKQDIAIPEKYGIFATVGDTAGPGGWSRSIRNIPVFMEFAEDFNAICPHAFIVNYTNPMSSLTATLNKLCGNPVVGLCHSYFETKDTLQEIFSLPDQSSLSLSIAGMNHFTWVTGFKIGREDGYRLLRRKIGGGSLRDVMATERTDEGEYFSGRELCAELYDTYGYLPYPGDRHISEFLPFVLSGWPALSARTFADGTAVEQTERYHVPRTAISHREREYAAKKKDVAAVTERLKNDRDMKLHKSRETGADMLAAYLFNRPLCDAVNTLNVGQIPGLPEGACVETIGIVDGMGVRPTVVGGIPDFLLEVMRPQAICQKWLTEGVINSDRRTLLNALYHDPQCKALTPAQIREMAGELFEANKSFIRF